jgi:hypothetical protein
MLEKSESPQFSSLVQQGTYQSVDGYPRSSLKETLNKKKRILLTIVTRKPALLLNYQNYSLL